MKRNFAFITIVLLSVFIMFPFANVSALVFNGERIDWYKKMTGGKDIAYWIDSNCEYTVSIPNAVQKLMYPDGLSNPLVLSYTGYNQNSKMDFYQYYDVKDDSAAYATTHRKNSSGEYYAMFPNEKDVNDWVYTEIHINDYLMNNIDNTKRETILIHEILHGYGLRDLYNDANKASIMYGRDGGVASGVTADANRILNDKYQNG